MAGDYSRNTFDVDKHFSAVLMQQGRVQLDADWNEQGDILTHYLRTLAADVIGPHGGPGNGFDIQPATRDGTSIRDFTIAPGRYYVDGILVENDAADPVPFSAQPDYEPDEGSLEDGNSYLVYLDVWEREITALQDPDIREVALKGADTAARLRVVWQVRVADWDEYKGGDATDPSDVLDRVRTALSTGLMSARALAGSTSDSPCSIAPGSSFRGPENQLYRVQIHRGGDPGTATFVWSRDNSTAALPITGVHDHSVTVESLGADDRLSVHAGDWVEVVDDTTDLEPQIAELVQVQGVDLVSRLVTLSGASPGVDDARHPVLRRWDHGGQAAELDDGALPLEEDRWLDLEDGVQIRFEPLGARYEAGDYWQVPARTANGDVDWPGDPDAPLSRPARGVVHHVAPLARILIGGSQVKVQATYRYTIAPVAHSS